jgi:hypothetical protein
VRTPSGARGNLELSLSGGSMKRNWVGEEVGGDLFLPRTLSDAQLRRARPRAVGARLLVWCVWLLLFGFVLPWLHLLAARPCFSLPWNAVMFALRCERVSWLGCFFSFFLVVVVVLLVLVFRFRFFESLSLGSRSRVSPFVGANVHLLLGVYFSHA